MRVPVRQLFGAAGLLCLWLAAAQPVSAQTATCCIQKESKHYTICVHDPITNTDQFKDYNPDDRQNTALGFRSGVNYDVYDRTGSCRVETIEEPCKTISVARETDNTPSACNPGYSTIIITTTGETAVPCSSQQSCIQAVNAASECALFRDPTECRANSNCFWFGSACFNKNDRGACDRITDKDYCGVNAATGDARGSLVCAWDQGQNRCLSAAEAALSQSHEGSGGFLPACAYAGNCRSVNDLVQVLISIAREAFKYIGSVAFLFFVYGGVTMILSFGNAEKVNKGKQILTAAVVGIAISFSAYLLVDFILKALQAGGVGF